MNKLTLIKQDIETSEREMYRALRTNIMFTGIENKIIAITSSFPGEGKSTVSLNLSLACAEDGKRTLYVDADMRKSVFLQNCKFKDLPHGLSHYLSGQETVKNIIYETNYQNLYVMPSGVFPRNPTELLGNERMAEMMRVLKNSFDYVIIDTPPLGSVIDAAVIAKLADASAFVVSSNMIERKVAQNVLNRLKSANPNFLGTVLNRMPVTLKSYNKYYGKYYGNYEEEK